MSVITVNPHSVGARLLEAVALKYKATISEAKATISVYAESPVAIGEHPQHIEEIDKLLDQIATAQDKLDALESHFHWRTGHTLVSMP